jgi:hypothetical protein
MWAFIKRLFIFLIIPIIVADIAGRYIAIRKERAIWYNQMIYQTEKRPVYIFFFIGTSRVAGTIDENTFDKKIPATYGSPVKSINLGRGYTNLIQHYLGLRKLTDAHPDVLRNSTVMIEAPDGLADIYCKRSGL